MNLKILTTILLTFLVTFLTSLLLELDLFKNPVRYALVVLLIVFELYAGYAIYTYQMKK